MNSGSGHVYFIRDLHTRHIKIGFSKDVARRMAALRCPNVSSAPESIELLASIPVSGLRIESALHKHFSATSVRNEWFSETPELMNLIASVVNGERDSIFGPRPEEEGIPEYVHRIAEARERRGLTQRAAARMLECHTTWVRDMESGKRPITVAWLYQFSKLYLVSTDWLIGG